MKNITTLLFFTALTCNLLSQSIDQIKSDRQTYIWGEGSGATLKKADQEALAMLINQVSTQVETKFTLLKSEYTGSNAESKFEEKFNSIINSYSNATLKNTERIVISDEPDAKVFRYIKRTELDKIFAERKNKIIGFVGNGIESLKNRQIADALRYYYWGLTLLKSHPEGSSISIITDDGKQNLLATWLPLQINNIFAGLSIGIAETNKDGTMFTVTLQINYQNLPVSNFDYSYWDGRDWSNTISAKDGLGYVEYMETTKDINEVKLKSEYVFEGEASVDNELRDVMQRIDPIPFRSSYITVKKGVVSSANNIAIEEPKKEFKSDDIWQSRSITLVPQEEQTAYKQAINNVEKAIRTKNFESVQSSFTPEGFKMFQGLVQYGQATILRDSEHKYVRFGKEVICRTIPMSFKFSNNNKQFVEDVIFHFDETKKIVSLSFGLGADALKDIVNKESWSEQVRLVLITFLEHYKTAYALKRLSYIESIFADDALIIVGSVLKITKDPDNGYLDNKIIKYNRLSKTEYLKNLKLSFQSNEFINLKFEDNEIRKSGKGGEVYGIQIKQSYSSTNYGDEGYLFLMVDLNNPNLPIIHVRTWQPEKNPDGTIYGLGDFN
ncbi:MAG: hypothetical protein AB9846_14955 [Tenuifilaceae bacterium]